MLAPELVYLCDNKRHLVCKPYSVENLHRMASDLGIKQCWYHGGKKPHYDIPVTRQAEITARCTVVAPREILQTINSRLQSPRTVEPQAAYTADRTDRPVGRPVYDALANARLTGVAHTCRLESANARLAAALRGVLPHLPPEWAAYATDALHAAHADTAADV